MTIDEAVFAMEHYKLHFALTPKAVKAFDMAIKALEQEPCDDAISRSATLDAIIKRLGIKDETYLLEAERVIYQQILAMPPVTPQQKMGRWIEHFDESGKWYECDQCHTDWGGTVNYCPNCGAKM